jgi:hypothetical protein
MIKIALSNLETRRVQLAAAPAATGLGAISAISVAENSGTPNDNTFYDSIIREWSGSTVHNDWQCSAFDGATIHNDTPEIATLDNAGRLTRVSNGIGTVRFQKGPARTERQYNCTQIENGTGLGFVGFSEGTVSRYLEDQVKAVIAADPTKRQVNYFSSINLPAGTYVRNTDCWARNLDLSSLSVGTSHGFDNNYTLQRPGTLITPRHVLVANHYPPYSIRYQNRSDFLRFLTPEGVLRTVRVSGASGRSGDMLVLTLSADVVGCNPAKVGANWLYQNGPTFDETYYSGLAINVDKLRQVGIVPRGRITGFCSGSPAPGSGFSQYNGVPITNALYVNGNYFYSNITDYDYVMENIDLAIGIGSGSSGSPQYLLVNGQMVVTHCWLTGSSGPCSWAGDGSNLVINKMILEADADAGISTGYTATQIVQPTL